MQAAKAILLCAFVSLSGPAVSEDSNALLAHIRARVMETIGRLPNYMCTETIDRLQFEPDSRLRIRSCEAAIQHHPKLRLASSDRLRLDVAVGTRTELYSWVGENRFEDRGLMAVVRYGPLSTGSFASFLNNIFGTDDATFSYTGESSLNGRRLAGFAFQVPLEKSEYNVHAPGTGWVTTAYEGSFLADLQSFDLVRLIIRTGKLPSATGACQDVTTLDYGLVRLNGAEFLLPSESRLRVKYENAIETENRTVYSACHEFRGESKLTFDPPDPEASTTKAVARSLVLPPGLSFTIALTRDIVTQTAAAGDSVPARLTTAIKDDSSEVLVPEGAEVICRIVRIQHFFRPETALSLALRLETMSVRGMPVRFAAVVNLDSREGMKTGLAAGLTRIHRIQMAELAGSDSDFKGQDETEVAAFEFAKTKPDHVIKRGLKLNWVTVEP
jgi:hypothetical protein